MRILRIIGISTLSLVTLFLLAAFTIPLLFQDTIAAKIQSEANKQIKGKLQFGDYNLSLFRAFPNVSFELEDFSIRELESKGNALLCVIPSFAVELNLWSVIKGDYTISGISMDSAQLYVKFDSTGNLNWDIFPSDTTAVPSNETEADSDLKIEIRSFAIRNTLIDFQDDSSKIALNVADLTLVGEAKMTNDIYELTSNLNIGALGFEMENDKFINALPIQIESSIEVNMSTSSYTIRSLDGKLAEVPISMKGFVQLLEDKMRFDLLMDSKDAEFKQLLSLLPESIAASLVGLDAKGKANMHLGLQGDMEGDNLPNIDFSISTKGASIAYTDLPAVLDNIQFEMTAKMPQGPLDGLIVEIPKANCTVGGASVSANLMAKNLIKDPFIRFGASGKVQFQNLKQYLPKDLIQDISGSLDIQDIQVATALSTIEAENWQDVVFSGGLTISNFSINQPDLQLKLQSLQASATPKSIQLAISNLQYGKSDVSFTGSAENVLAYVLDDKANIFINANANSTLFDVDAILAALGTDSTAVEAETSEASTEILPTDITINFNLNAQSILYDGLTISNASLIGNVTNGVLNIQNLSANALGGKLQATGRVFANENPLRYDIGYDMQNVSIGQVFQYLDMMKQIAPIFQYMQGNISSNLRLSGKLGEDMSPEIVSVTADGLLAVISSQIKAFPPMQALSSQLKWNGLNNLDLGQQSVQFEVQNGRVNVKPFVVPIQIGRMQVSGSHGLDQSLQYVLDFEIPYSEAKQLGIGLAKLEQNAQKLGFKVDPTDKVLIQAKMGGTITKPSIQMQVSETISKGIKSAIQAETEKVKDEAKDAFKDMQNTTKEAAKDAFKTGNVKDAGKSVQSKADSIAKSAKNKAKNFWPKKK